MALIELTQVTKYYEMGNQIVRALDGIDIAVEVNDYMAFVGSSGSGKSTMLNILGCGCMTLASAVERGSRLKL